MLGEFRRLKNKDEWRKLLLCIVRREEGEGKKSYRRYSVYKMEEEKETQGISKMDMSISPRSLSYNV